MERLNGIVRALESGLPAFLAFSSTSTQDATAYGASAYDGVIVETEHPGFDAGEVQHYLQHLLDRRQIATSGSVAPSVTPVVRVPSNGSERTQWFAKQALDAGAYGIVWPHVDSAEEAAAAVAACRYPDRDGTGARGYGARAAARYFGLTAQDYHDRAGVWPLDPDGELLVVVMVESGRAVADLGRMLAEVAGIGAVLLGHGDLALSLGHAGQTDHPDVRRAETAALDECRRAGVVCGLVATAADVEPRVDEGYRFLVVQPEWSNEALLRGRLRAGIGT